jgi:hypothetical protein
MGNLAPAAVSCFFGTLDRCGLVAACVAIECFRGVASLTQRRNQLQKNDLRWVALAFEDSSQTLVNDAPFTA